MINRDRLASLLQSAGANVPNSQPETLGQPGPWRENYALPRYGPAPGPEGPQQGMVAPGNIDLAHRPMVRNRDGSVSTVRSMSVEMDGRHYLLPTVSPDGRILPDDQAVQLFRRTGQNLGEFNSDADADAYAQRLHQAQEQFYAPAPRYEDLQPLQDRFFRARDEAASRQFYGGQFAHDGGAQAQGEPDPTMTPLARGAYGLADMLTPFPSAYRAGQALGRGDGADAAVNAAQAGLYFLPGMRGERAVARDVRPRLSGTSASTEQPLLYHGNAAHLGEVRPRLFATNDVETASFFAKLDRNRTHGARRLNPIQPDFTNPMVIDGQGHMITHATMRRGRLPQILDEAEAAGHDAVVFRNVTDGPGAASRDQMPIDVTVVLNPRNVTVGRPEYLDNPSIVDRIRDVFTSRPTLQPRDAPRMASRQFPDANATRPPLGDVRTGGFAVDGPYLPTNERGHPVATEQYPFGFRPNPREPTAVQTDQFYPTTGNAAPFYDRSVFQEETLPTDSLIGTQSDIRDNFLNPARAGDVGQPISVVRTPDGRNYIINGHHRTAAAVAQAEPSIPARVYQGSLEPPTMHGSPDIAMDPMANPTRPGMPRNTGPRFAGMPNEDRRWPMFGERNAEPVQSSGTGDARSERLPRQVVDIFGQTKESTPTIRNPSEADIMRLTRPGAARGVRYVRDGQNIYVGDSYHVTHQNLIEAHGLPPRGRLDGGEITRREDGSLVLLNDDGAQPLPRDWLRRPSGGLPRSMQSPDASHARPVQASDGNAFRDLGMAEDNPRSTLSAGVNPIRPRGFAPGSAEVRAQRNARIMELYREMQPVPNKSTGAANPQARLGVRLDNSFPAIAERLRAEGYTDVTPSSIRGVLKRARDAQATGAVSQAVDNSQYADTARRLGLSEDRVRALSAQRPQINAGFDASAAMPWLATGGYFAALNAILNAAKNSGALDLPAFDPPLGSNQALNSNPVAQGSRQ